MSIVKAGVIPKVDARVSTLPLENKVVAEDINEFKRVTDEIIDAFSSAVLPAEKAFAGLAICQGVLSQTLDSQDLIYVDQWSLLQPEFGFVVANGDQALTAPVTAIYRVDVTLSYETDAKNGEVFKFTVEDNNVGAIPGLCTKVQHQHAQTTVYNAHMMLFTPSLANTEFRVAVEAVTVAQPRTFAIKHGSFMMQQVSQEFTPGGGG